MNNNLQNHTIDHKTRTVRIVPKLFALGLIVFSQVFATQARAAGATAEQILREADAVRAPGNNFSFDARLTYKSSGKQVVQDYHIAVKDGVKSLVKFVAPAENRGRVLLMVGQNLWIYMPTVNQPIRISPQQRLLGQVANGDVARVAYHFDYAARSENAEKLDGEACVRLELSAKTDQATYGKIVLWVSAEDSEPRKAQFHAVSGKLLKTAYYRGYREVLGKRRPMTTVIEDELRPGESTVMEMSRFKVESLPESSFRKDGLKYVR